MTNEIDDNYIPGRRTIGWMIDFLSKFPRETVIYGEVDNGRITDQMTVQINNPCDVLDNVLIHFWSLRDLQLTSILVDDEITEFVENLTVKQISVLQRILKIPQCDIPTMVECIAARLTQIKEM